MYRCPACGGNHRKAETARKCAEAALNAGKRGLVSNTPEVRRIERSYDAWATSPERGMDLSDAEVIYDAEEILASSVKVPNGHYFIPAEYWDKKNGVRVLARKFSSGRWKDLWFVTLFDSDGNPELVRELGERQYVVEKIFKAGALYCMTQYGRLFSRCGICNEELDIDEAQQYGGHPECFRPYFAGRIETTTCA